MPKTADAASPAHSRTTPLPPNVPADERPHKTAHRVHVPYCAPVLLPPENTAYTSLLPLSAACSPQWREDFCQSRLPAHRCAPASAAHAETAHRSVSDQCALPALPAVCRNFSTASFHCQTAPPMCGNWMYQYQKSETFIPPSRLPFRVQPRRERR